MLRSFSQHDKLASSARMDVVVVKEPPVTGGAKPDAMMASRRAAYPSPHDSMPSHTDKGGALSPLPKSVSVFWAVDCTTDVRYDKEYQIGHLLFPMHKVARNHPGFWMQNQSARDRSKSPMSIGKMRTGGPGPRKPVQGAEMNRSRRLPRSVSRVISHGRQTTVHDRPRPVKLKP